MRFMIFYLNTSIKKIFCLPVPHLQKNSCNNLSVPAPSFSMKVDCSSSNPLGKSSADITPRNIYIIE